MMIEKHLLVIKNKVTLRINKIGLLTNNNQANINKIIINKMVKTIINLTNIEIKKVEVVLGHFNKEISMENRVVNMKIRNKNLVFMKVNLILIRTLK